MAPAAPAAGEHVAAVTKTFVVEAPRKLVRPRLGQQAPIMAQAPRRLRGDRPFSNQESLAPVARSRAATAGSAEGLFLQKQMQLQTPLVFVLEDGEQIQGVIEWYDRESIKIRNSTRVLLFKRAIKYLHKAGDTAGN